MSWKVLRSTVTGLLLVALTASGCTQLTDGAAVRGSVTIGPEGVDLSALDPGDYPTTPAPPYGVAGSVEVGTAVEGARLADYVVLPTDVGSSLSQLDYTSTSLMSSPDDLATALTDHAVRPVEIADAAARHSFVVGFSSGRTQSNGPAKLTNAVLVFPDTSAASAAATDMAAASAAGTPTPVAGHDGTLAFLARTDDLVTITALTPHDRYVLLQWVQLRASEDAATAVAVVLERQEPLIDEFTPTDPNALAQLPVDPSGVLARTIVFGAADKETVEDVAFGPVGAVHLEPRSVEMAGLYEQLHVDGVAMGQTSVYQSNRHDGGRLLSDALAESAVEDFGYTPAADVPNLTAARCFSRAVDAGVRHYCVGMSSRWGFSAWSTDKTQLDQLMSAQFLILAA